MYGGNTMNNNQNNKPIIGITMGDPFGNGPEITIKTLADFSLYERCRPIVIGDTTAMELRLCRT